LLAEEVVMATLVINGLCKHYRSGDRLQPVLKGLDLRLNGGEVLALLGPSGSGKSSLLHLIAGIESADSGTIHLLNQPMTTLNERQRTLFRRRHIGVVFQFFNLIPTLTVEENVLLPLQLNRRTQDYDQARIELQRLGLGERLGDYPEQLSGGEQQRVAICRALIHQPALLLADEPTGSLDNETAEQVMGWMLDQVRSRNQTLIMVTHNPDYVRYADRALRLHQGALVPL
jgi:putative ABC transport system ATP-binding protein